MDTIRVKGQPKQYFVQQRCLKSRVYIIYIRPGAKWLRLKSVRRNRLLNAFDGYSEAHSLENITRTNAAVRDRWEIRCMTLLDSLCGRYHRVIGQWSQGHLLIVWVRFFFMWQRTKGDCRCPGQFLNRRREHFWTTYVLWVAAFADRIQCFRGPWWIPTGRK
jgi:hypothetical protein